MTIADGSERRTWSPYNLLFERWIPIRRRSGKRESIAPFEITSRFADDPVVYFAWPRPDFDLASHEFLIGLLAAIHLADPNQPKQWKELFHSPPCPDQLIARLKVFADAFVLNGDGPRFLQDFEELVGEESPIETLLIEAPGANTIRLNADLFIKRGRVRVLSRASAAMGLYTMQQFAPTGGAGHRTSLRGGGPLITLALPDGGRTASPVLWQRLWLNTSSSLGLDPNDKAAAFPWLARTRPSENGEVVHEDAADVHRLQAFFGMPRRIRLKFEANTDKLPCDLTGVVDDFVCTGYVSRPRGINYGVWRHPLTPYYKRNANSSEPALAVHAPKGHLGYREWLGLVFEDPDKSFPADAVVKAKSRLWDLGSPWKDNSRLLAGGYAMDKMKALAFIEAEMPLHSLDPSHAADLQRLARLMVGAASDTVHMLSSALRRALFGPNAEVRIDQTVLSAPAERFWLATEDEFHKILDAAPDALGNDPRGDKQEKLAREWRNSLEHAALRIFDETASINDFGELEPERIVEARKILVFSLKGFGKSGSQFFRLLGLDPPKAVRTIDGASSRRNTGAT